MNAFDALATVRNGLCLRGCVAIRETLGIMVVLLATVIVQPLGGAPARPDWWWPRQSEAPWMKQSLGEIRVMAEKDDAAAQYYYGRACFFGQVTGADLRESFQWVHRSAQLGYVQAQIMTALFFYRGVATIRDEAEGSRWISRAVAQGHPDAMGVQGEIYEFGWGTPRDPAKAREWLLRAVEAGSTIAPYWLGRSYLRGDGSTTQRTNYVEALRYYEQAASNGHVLAAITVADLCRKGLGTPPDFQKVLHWFRFCVDRGNPDSMEQLAGIYATGLAEPRGAGETPVRLYRRAAVSRVNAALEPQALSMRIVTFGALMDDCRELWNRYRFGIGTPRDYVAAAEWMWVAHLMASRRIAEGKIPADDELGKSPFDPILQGKVPPLTSDERLWQQGVRLIHKALDQGRPEAWQRIGESYRDGSTLTPKQPLMAWGWLARAAEMGHAPARASLKALEESFTAEELADAKRFWVPPLIRNN